MPAEWHAWLHYQLTPPCPKPADIHGRSHIFRMPRVRRRAIARPATIIVAAIERRRMAIMSLLDAGWLRVRCYEACHVAGARHWRIRSREDACFVGHRECDAGEHDANTDEACYLRAIAWHWRSETGLSRLHMQKRNQAGCDLHRSGQRPDAGRHTGDGPCENSRPLPISANQPACPPPSMDRVPAAQTPRAHSVACRSLVPIAAKRNSFNPERRNAKASVLGI